MPEDAPPFQALPAGVRLKVTSNTAARLSHLIDKRLRKPWYWSVTLLCESRISEGKFSGHKEEVPLLLLLH